MKRKVTRLTQLLAWALAAILLRVPAAFCAEEVEEPAEPSLPQRRALLPDEASRPYAPRTLRGLSNAELFEWMSAGRSIRDKARMRKEPLAKTELWGAPVEAVIQALWDHGRPASADQGARFQIDPATTGSVPAEGTVVLRHRFSSCSGIQTVRWQLAWSPDRAWLVVGSEEKGLAEEFFVMLPAQSPLWTRELSAAQGRRLAELVLALAAAKPAPRDSGKGSTDESLIVSLHVEGELIVRDAALSEALVERRGPITGLIVNGVEWDGEWREDFPLCLVAGLLDAALRPWPPRRDRTGVGEAARRQAVAFVFSRDAAETGSVHPFHLARAAAQAGEAGWLELRRRVADLGGQIGEVGEWERRSATRAAEIQRLTETLRARWEPALTEDVIASDARTFIVEEDGTRRSDEDASPEARRELQALRALREERRRAETSDEFGNPDEPERATAVLRRALALAARRMDAWNDRDALLAWAGEGSAWAYQRLRAIAPATADSFLVAQLSLHPTLDDDLRRVAAELAKVSPGASRVTLANLPPERREFLAREEGEDERLRDLPASELLARVQDRERTSRERLAALRKLSASGDEGLRPGGALDRAVADTLRREPAPKEEYDRVIPALAEALARNGAEHWDVIGEAAAKIARRNDRGASVIAGLVPALLDDPKRWQARMAELLRSRLKKGRGRRDELIWLAWTTDVRELRDLIAGIGTFAPDDQGADEDGSEDESMAPHRVHVARQVASLWDESDAGTRLRLLAAMAFRNAKRFALPDGDSARRLAAQWRRDAAQLLPGETTGIQGAVRALDAAELADGEHDEEAISSVLRQLFRASFGR